MSNNVMLKVSDLKTYFFTRRGTVKAVNGVDFELKRGECLCLVGESGCGKTVTALSILRLFDSPPGKIVDGQISFDSLDLVKCSSAQMRQIRGKDIAIVFQEAQSALNPVLTIGNQITEQIKLHLPLDHNHIVERAITMLGDVGIPSPASVMNYYPHQLSGGMKQRVLIAMSLSCDPKILIADEPTTAVDVTIKAQILDIFRELKVKRQMSTIFITHDLAVVAEIGDRAVIMYGGKDVETAPVSEIISRPKHPYTRGLIDCLPDSSKSGDRLISIPGTTPNPTEMPTGCAFHPRCPRAMKICGRQEPLKTAISNVHSVSCHLYT
jgi:peptide/nickel transport system ATP-binding protein